MLKQDFLTYARDNAESPFEFRYTHCNSLSKPAAPTNGQVVS
jgi:hypothetical protein